MPFDSTPLPTIDPVLKPGLAGLAQLEHALRVHALWPDHQWDFGAIRYPTPCGTAGCAIGLAQVLWPEALPDSRAAEEGGFFIMVARQFLIKTAEAERLFDITGYSGLDYDSVAPEDVADAISALLKEKGYQEARADE